MDLFKKPERAHTLVLKAGGDSAERLADELRHLADCLDRDQLSAGCSGSPSGGSIYSYRVSPMTHDEYFEAVARALSDLLCEPAAIKEGD